MQALGVFLVPADHPCLPGHFPGRPLAPGVLLLDEAGALVSAAYPGRRIEGFGAVRLVRPVRPGDVVEVSGDGALLRCVVDGQVVLTGSVILAPAP